jgi:hypothetical protein
MIDLNVNWEELLGESRSLAARFRALPAHIGKKHLVASMRKAVRDAKGPQLLRKNTPPLNTKRGRKAKGAKRSTGALRKAVTVKAKWIGRNRDGAAFAGLGYKYGDESLKAIYLEFGTTRVQARRMAQRTYDEIRGPMRAALSKNLVDALDKAVAELASKKNPGYGG